MDTRTFYDRISEAYGLLAGVGESAFRDQGLCALKASPGERVLEVGCGTGHALAALAAAVGRTGRVVGINLSPGMLGVAQRRVKDAANVSLARGDARSLCLLDAEFDAVFISFTIELFTDTDIQVALAEIKRVLRPKGRLAVVAMAEATHSTGISDVYRWLHRHFPDFVDCHPIDVSGFLRRAGFQTTHQDAMWIWGLPVIAVVASKR